MGRGFTNAPSRGANQCPVCRPCDGADWRTVAFDRGARLGFPLSPDPPMSHPNVHHLELFYYVARHGGITEAARNMPYGIQQPAVSGQILQLEKSLGVKLFHRRPFALTPAGEELYGFVRPFFSQIGTVAERLSGDESRHLRLAATATILANHLPAVLERLRRQCPGMRLTLRDVKSPDIEPALLRQEADLALSVLPAGRPAPGLKSVKLLDLPLVLLAPPGSVVRPGKFPAFLADRAGPGGELTLPLVCLPEPEPLARHFQAGLARHSLRWVPTVEVNELSLVRRYVAEGFGWGVSLAIPGAAPDDGVAAIPLPAADFAPLGIGLTHPTDLKPLGLRFVEIARAYAAELSQPAPDRARQPRGKVRD